jgi:molybdate transport system substrate-binding protein
LLKIDWEGGVTIKGLSSMATRELLAQLAAPGCLLGIPSVSFESAGGVEVARRVRDGEGADLVVLAEDAITSLSREGLVVGSSVRGLFESDVVIAVREEVGPTPDVSTVAALQSTLRNAKTVGFSTGPSGAGLTRMLDLWGLADELANRLVLAPPGVPVARLLTDGIADLGFQQRSELSAAPGVRILGPMPEGAEVRTVFTGAVLTRSTQQELAGRILSAMASEQVWPALERHGFRPAS